MLKVFFLGLFLMTPVIFADVVETWKAPAYITHSLDHKTRILTLTNKNNGKKIVWNDHAFQFANGTFIILTDKNKVSRAFNNDLDELAYTKNTYVRNDALYKAYTGGNDHFGYFQTGNASKRNALVFTLKGPFLEWNDLEYLEMNGEHLLLSDTNGITEVYSKKNNNAIVRWLNTSANGYGMNTHYFFLRDTKGITEVLDYDGKSIHRFTTPLKAVKKYQPFLFLLDDKDTARIYGRTGKNVETLEKVTKVDHQSIGGIFTLVITYDSGKTWQAQTGF